MELTRRDFLVGAGATCGWVEDFRLAAAFLRPLADAGIALSFAMGNHDNRACFLKVFPDYKARLLMPDRIVSKVSTPNADLVRRTGWSASRCTTGAW